MAELAGGAADAASGGNATYGGVVEESAADSFFATSTGEEAIPSDSLWSGVGIAAVGSKDPGLAPDGDGSLDTARLGKLRHEAQLRAEHQAAARLTMLDLARALDESHARQRELARLLDRERERTTSLRSRCDNLEDELEKALLAEEKRQAEKLLQKGFESGNKIFLAMMLEKSREVYKSDMFAPAAEEVGDEEGDRSGSGGSAGEESDPDAHDPDGGADGSDNPQGGAADGGEGREAGTDGSAADGGKAGKKRPRRRSVAKSVFQGLQRRYNVATVASEGDKVTFSWIFKLWLREVNLTKTRLAEEEAARLKRLQEEEQRRRMQEEVDRRVGEVRKLAESLGKQLDAAQDVIEQQKKRIRYLEKELEQAALDAAEREKQHEAAMAQLRAQLAQTQEAQNNSLSSLQKLRDEYEEAQAAFRRAEAEHEAERRQLQETIRKISSELHEAVVLAKYMRETMLKCKRDAAASVSPAKFAELIAQLEEMRDQLNALRKDYSGLKDSNADLQQRLDKNRRRLELERQFLPLIRHARGPLGPKAGFNSVVLAPMPEQHSPEMPKKLHRSHSTASHVGKGYALGGVP